MKKVLFLLLIGVVIGYLVKSNGLVLGNVSHFIPQSNQSVQGASTSAKTNDFSLIQQQLAKLSVSDIATSSPQVQTIIHLLQKMPKDQLKSVCQNVCNGIK